MAETVEEFIKGGEATRREISRRKFLVKIGKAAIAFGALAVGFKFSVEGQPIEKFTDFLAKLGQYLEKEGRAAKISEYRRELEELEKGQGAFEVRELNRAYPYPDYAARHKAHEPYLYAWPTFNSPRIGPLPPGLRIERSKVIEAEGMKFGVTGPWRVFGEADLQVALEEKKARVETDPQTKGAISKLYEMVSQIGQRGRSDVYFLPIDSTQPTNPR